MFIYNINISFSYSNYLPTIEVGGYSDYFSPKTGVIDGTGTTLVFKPPQFQFHLKSNYT